MSIGERIIELRTACGLSQNQLAKTMEVSRQSANGKPANRFRIP